MKNVKVKLTMSQNVNRLIVHVEQTVETSFDVLQWSIACVRRKTIMNNSSKLIQAFILTCVHIRIELQMLGHVLPCQQIAWWRHELVNLLIDCIGYRERVI
jgi:hypothetical protein